MDEILYTPLKNLCFEDLYIYLINNLQKYDIDKIYESYILSNELLYRIRKLDKKFDIHSEKEWFIPPIEFRKMNRCNNKQKGALYLSDNLPICSMELDLKKNEVFACCQYDIKTQLKLKTLYTSRDYDTDRETYPELFCLLNIISSVMTIPTFAGVKIKNRKTYINKSLKNIIYDHHTDGGAILPFLLKEIVKNDSDLYILTNLIVDNFNLEDYDGLMYSSCYFPCGHSYFKTTQFFNLCILEKSVNKININQIYKVIMRKDMQEDLINKFSTFIEKQSS